MIPTAKRFIVKVQLSLNTTADEQQCLIYNQNKSVMIQRPVDADLLAMANGRPKFYCWAELVPNGDGTYTINLAEECLPQTW